MPNKAIVKLTWIACAVALLGLMLLTVAAQAANVTLQWDDTNPPEVGVQGYTLYWGLENPPQNEIDVPDGMQATVPNLTVGTVYYFSVAAYTATAPSARSNVLEYKVPEESKTITVVIPAAPEININIKVEYKTP